MSRIALYVRIEHCMLLAGFVQWGAWVFCTLLGIPYGFVLNTLLFFFWWSLFFLIGIGKEFEQ